MPRTDDAFEALAAEWIGEIGQLHLSVKALPETLAKAVKPSVQAMKDAEEKLGKLLKDLPTAVENARIEAFDKMAEETGEMIGLATATARMEATWKATGAIGCYSALMLGVGVLIGDNRAGWGSPVAISVACALGVFAGVMIGYRIAGPIREKRAELARANSEKQEKRARAEAYANERGPWKERIEAAAKM